MKLKVQILQKQILEKTQTDGQCKAGEQSTHRSGDNITLVIVDVTWGHSKEGEQSMHRSGNNIGLVIVYGWLIYCCFKSKK
jgi:hypothetical protein